MNGQPEFQNRNLGHLRVDGLELTAGARTFAGVDGSLSFEVFAGRPETPARARHEPTSLPSIVLSDGERVMLATSRELADAMRRLLAATERQTAELGRMRDQHRMALAQLSEQMLKLELGLEAVRNRHRSWLRRLLGR